MRGAGGAAKNSPRPRREGGRPGRDQAADQGFSVLAVAGPVPWSKHKLGGFPKTGAGTVRINGVERKQAVR